MKNAVEKNTPRLRSLSLRRISVILFLILAVPILTQTALTHTASAASVREIPKSFGPTNVIKCRTYEGSWKQYSKKIFRFTRSNGKLAKSRWFHYNDAIYLVDEKGNRVSGWVKYRDHLYYLQTDGKLRLGWLAYKYYLKPTSGRMAVNTFYKIDGATYYFNKAGVKQTGFQTIKGSQYFFFANGKLAANRWVKYNGNYYRIQADGKVMKSAWLELSGKKYYLGSNGARVTGEQYIGNTWYTFNSAGVLIESSVIDTTKPMVALTFDDGPSIYTPRLLACLKRYNAHATFFMMGDRVLSYPSAVKQMVQYGCELGNHSMTHSAMTTLPLYQVEQEFSQTSANIYSVCGRYPTVARLPYGDGYNNSSILQAVGLPSIYWSIDTEDWANTGNPQSTIDAVLGSVRSGDIILMHDLHSATVTAAETIIPTLVQRGYQLVTVSELARYKGGTSLAVGRTYFSF